MAILDICENIPYTISIQFDVDKINWISKQMKKYNLTNKVGSHISLKYLGYDTDLTNEKTLFILKKLTDELKITKERIYISNFEIMKHNNPFFNNLLYLKVEPFDYFYKLHTDIINIFENEIDYFRYHDKENFIPHISCGEIQNIKILDQLNKELKKYDKMFIDEWYLILHTSKKEYKFEL